MVPFGAARDDQDDAGSTAKPGISTSNSIFSTFADGITYAWQNPTLRTLLAVGFVGEVMAFNYISLAPIFATDTFDGGSGLLGALEGTMPAGEAIGVLVLASIGIRLVKTGRWFLVGMIVVHIVAIPLALSSNLPTTILLLGIMGAFASLIGVLQSRVIIEVVPQGSRARLLGVQQMTWGGGAIGGFTAGWLAEIFSPGSAVASMAAVGLALALLIAVVGSRLRKMTMNSPSE
jgi:hypothetical protein